MASLKKFLTKNFVHHGDEDIEPQAKDYLKEQASTSAKFAGFLFNLLLISGIITIAGGLITMVGAAWQAAMIAWGAFALITAYMYKTKDEGATPGEEFMHDLAQVRVWLTTRLFSPRSKVDSKLGFTTS